MGIKNHISYAESETGTIQKSWANRTSIALVYPNLYGIGMSNLGFLSVYQLLNNFDDVVCERAFLPDKNQEKGPIRTIESKRPLNEFDIIAFSVSFENDFSNMLTIIRNSGIPLHSNARGDSHPLLIAGGVACLLNPEPVANFIDCFLIGEGESLFGPFIENIDFSIEKNQLLLKLAKNVPGMYVPRFYDPLYQDDGTLLSFIPNQNVPEKIKRVYLSDLSNVPTFSSVVTPEAAFDSSWLIEVSRGCAHGCRFCSAGYIYRPPRFRSLDFLKKCFKEGEKVSDKIGLVGTAISDHPEIGKMCSGFENDALRFSFSSLRADALTDDHIAVLKKSNVKTATIAPDAGSERMRAVINKGITKEHVLTATAKLVSAGIPNLKVYFMVGLPGERQEDIIETIEFCKEIKSVFLESSRVKGRIGHITISINPFVPKPLTPFQWAAMDSVNTLKKKINEIKNGLRRVANMSVNSESPRSALVQALLSRGDRRTSEILVKVLDAENDWAQVIKASKKITAHHVHRERDFEEMFPWDFMDHGIKKSYLENEYKRALKCKTSPPCPIENCTLCGVCSK